MKAARIITLGALVAALSGCGGVEWFPEPEKPAPPTSDWFETTDVGGFVSSERTPEARTFTTEAEKGVFLTHTSVRVPVGTPVALENYYDGESKLLVARLLRASDQAVVVVSVVSLGAE